MTMGQRIALKRRELGLSQEGLGARLGVSRQAIYKWESDAALPEIEKLVNLSREFSVSVGWLLGEEDETQEQRELTPEQLRMVEEIVGRYLDARAAEDFGKRLPDEGDAEPKAPVRKRRWPYIFRAAVVIAALGMFANLFSRLDSLNQEYQNLQNSVYNIQNGVDRQIGSITGRVEAVLQNQNTLTAEQSAWVSSTDCRANTVTVEARAVPRTYVEGMTAEFLLVSDEETVTVPGTLGETHAFAAELTGPLTDEVTVSVAFLTEGQRQTQVLEQFTGLYSNSFPGIDVYGGMCRAEKAQTDESWTVSFQPVHVRCFDQWGNPPKLTSLRVGLFRDQKLVQWLVEEEQGGDDGSFRSFRLEQKTMLLETGHNYLFAAVVTDEYDREWLALNQHGGITTAGDRLDSFHDMELSVYPADWDY